MYQFKIKLEKIDYFKALSENVEQELAQLKTKVKELSAEAAKYQDEIAAIKSEISDEMLEDGCLEHNQNGIIFKLHKKPQSLDIVCKPEELPDEYQRIKIEADKSKLKKDFKDGLATNYCRLSEPEYKLVIEHG